MRGLWLGVVVALLAVAGCGDDDDAAQVCAPGKQEACTCEDGTTSAQACNADGTGYGACSCGSGGSAGSGGGGFGSNPDCTQQFPPGFGCVTSSAMPNYPVSEVPKQWAIYTCDTRVVDVSSCVAVTNGVTVSESLICCEP